MERLHIAFFGPVNSGKSTLVNAICGQEVSLVSSQPGTTTDPVRKTVELPGLGPCVLIDTAGLDDESLLGPERRRRTLAILDETDVAVLVVSGSLTSQTLGRWEQNSGVNGSNVPGLRTLAQAAGIPTLTYTRGESVESLLERIRQLAPKEEERFLTGNLVKAGDCVLLVMPQDSEAPKGRLILPQVQVIRELLDRGCIPVCCTPDSLAKAVETVTPRLVITDSQVFGLVNRTIPAEWPLTSFSILLAGAKGDLKAFLEGAGAIDRLQPGDRVLIAEACTHVPDTEDIGRVKIPALLQSYVAGEGIGLKTRGHPRPRKREGPIEDGKGRSESEGGFETYASASVIIDIAAGNDFPEDLSPYALIIHCGACVATRTLVQHRIKKALLAGVPITNYGIALAKLTGILDRIVIP